MTEAGLPAILSDLVARKSCARCHGPLHVPEAPPAHVNWDPRGEICDLCWLEEVEPQLDQEWQEALADHRAEMAELRKEGES